MIDEQEFKKRAEMEKADNTFLKAPRHVGHAAGPDSFIPCLAL